MRILAVVAREHSQVGGGAPIFYAADAEEQANVAFLLSKILGAAVHDLDNQVLIVVKH